jgi:hypothetical protein
MMLNFGNLTGDNTSYIHVQANQTAMFYDMPQPLSTIIYTYEGSEVYMPASVEKRGFVEKVPIKLP